MSVDRLGNPAMIATGSTNAVFRGRPISISVRPREAEITASATPPSFRGCEVGERVGYGAARAFGAAFSR